MANSASKSQPLDLIRRQATLHEKSREAIEKKLLGQYFTGLPLSRLLAALSVPQTVESVIDPMAGSGDLLDAVVERSLAFGAQLTRLDAIEIDTATADLCRQRLDECTGNGCVSTQVSIGSAFDLNILRGLSVDGYDLVIANPPYVRYQAIGRRQGEQTADEIRQALLSIVSEREAGAIRGIWQELIRGYSGHSDLAVPSWILASLLVKPGGKLAVVAPATWRTRDYADVVQYLLAKLFRVNAIVADRQPGWFSTALVRTHLVVATRLDDQEAATSLSERPNYPSSVFWAELEATAKGGDSLVGSAFPTKDPEADFRNWLFDNGRDPHEAGGGVHVLDRNLSEVAGVPNTGRARRWFRQLESQSVPGPLFQQQAGGSPVPQRRLPSEILEALPTLANATYQQASESGLQISQGLRTGCNGFFYVDVVEQVDDQFSLVKLDWLLGGGTTVLPNDALRPAVRSQSEVRGEFVRANVSSRVLDLRQYALPEDLIVLQQARGSSAEITRSFKPMPQALAELVRRAAHTLHGKGKHKTRIPELSAVRTNVRKPNGKYSLPRFWYMLPDFRDRHAPSAFVARVNQRTPRVLANMTPPLLIDANFSTLWSADRHWNSKSICGVLNSSWCRTCMEFIGTPMGGGALKLESTHLRRLPLPALSPKALTDVATLMAYPSESDAHGEHQRTIDHIVIKAMLPGASDRIADAVTETLNRICIRAMEARQRGR